MCVACFTHETYINYNLNSLQMYQIKLNYVAKKILIKITTNKIYNKNFLINTLTLLAIIMSSIAIEFGFISFIFQRNLCYLFGHIKKIFI